MTQAQDEKVGNTQEKKFIVGEHQCSWGENLPGQTLSLQAAQVSILWNDQFILLHWG